MAGRSRAGTITALVLGVLLLTACSRSDRYEIVKVDKGLIRLDKQSGEMVALDEKMTPMLVRVPLNQADSSVLPGISKVKTLTTFDLPDSKAKIQITVESRWRDGRIDYRVSATPAVPVLAKLNLLSNQDNVLEIHLLDADGFTISTITPLFWAGNRVDKSLVEERWTEMSATDYQRIMSASPTWRYSQEVRQELAQ